MSKINLSNIDHVAIAVPQGQLDNMLAVYKKMGLTVYHEESVYGTDQVREVMLKVGDSDNYLQLLEPLAPESPVAKQVEKNGGRAALAHVAFRVDDIQTTFDAMKEEGINIIDKAPRKGGSGATVFFIHPKTSEEGALGVLYEVVEPPKEEKH
jgi:methylmalonyl-CoA/ethylmalonyl-CoA epimerase